MSGEKQKLRAGPLSLYVGVSLLAMLLIVPTLRVGMHPVTLRVTLAQDSSPVSIAGTQSVPGGIPTRSMGTISNHYAQALKNQVGP